MYEPQVYLILKVSVLSKSDTAKVVELIRSSWPAAAVPHVKNFKSFEVDSERQLLSADDFLGVIISGKTVVPCLGQSETLDIFPSVIVDMGAIKFVCNGAKILRPGIVEFGSFKKGNIVTVRDQQHRKALAVGIALEDSEIAKSMEKGYIVDNIHYVSDKVWELAKQVKTMHP